LTAVSAIPFPAIDAARAELAKRCRQICLAIEITDAPTKLRSIDHELADALAAVRAAHGPDSVHEDDLLDLFRAEQLRVTDAAVLAELLAPKLAAYLRKHGLTHKPVAAPSASEPFAPAPSATAKSAAEHAPLSASSTLPAAPAGPPGIADLLDGMLEQDRHEERTRRTGPRR
jgi:hypothetical protein